MKDYIALTQTYLSKSRHEDSSEILSDIMMELTSESNPAGSGGTIYF